MKKRNLLTLVLALALVAALAVGGTLAYFTDNDTQTNTFTMGNVNINLEESNTKDPDTNEDVWTDEGLGYTSVLPGNVETKKARVTVDTKSADCYVKVNIKLEYNPFSETTGMGLNDQDVAALKAAVSDAITKNLDGTDKTDCMWDVTPTDDGFDCVYKGTDGNRIAHPDDALMLFEQIRIPTSFGNNVAGEGFQIKLTAYAIQSDNLEYDPSIWSMNFEKYPVVPEGDSQA